jgi:uncharacterized protein (DUF2164 family)
MEQTTTTTQTLLNAIADLSAQLTELTEKNLQLEKTVESLNSTEGNEGVIDSIIKTLPRERVLEVLGVSAEVKLDDIDSAVLLEYVAENYGVDEVFSSRQIRDYAYDKCIDELYDEDIICEWVKDNRSMDDIYDSDDIVEWVKDNRNCCDVYDHSDIVDCVTDLDVSDVLTAFGEEVVMEECSNQGWTKSKDVSDVISQLEDIIETLKA